MLTIAISIFFFTVNLSGSFLPVYYQETGMGLQGIVQLFFFTFVVIGLLPLFLLRVVKNFERILSAGFFLTMVFFIILIYTRNPILLGFIYGMSMATFWPSFNLLQFRLSESHTRARIVSLFTLIIPSLASIVGPALGGSIIAIFGFTTLFAVSIILYLIAFLCSTRIKFEKETHKFSLPKGKLFLIFFSTFVLLGLVDAWWFAYPLFTLYVSETVFNMGLVLAASAVLICVVTFLVNWLSDVVRKRVGFAVLGAGLYALWFFLIAKASTTYEIVILSLVAGLAAAFNVSWTVHYCDSFRKEDYASILVMMEVGLMIGRVFNLAPTYIFLSEVNYSSYFALLGIIAAVLAVVCISAKMIKSRQEPSKTEQTKTLS